MLKKSDIFNNCLVLEEQLLSIVGDLELDIQIAPDYSRNYSCNYEGEIALTNRRLIIHLNDGECWKYISIATINNLSERLITKDQPRWPYQAILGIPGGYGLIIQTKKTNEEQQKKLSSIINISYVNFITRNDDIGAGKYLSEKGILMQQQLLLMQQGKNGRG